MFRKNGTLQRLERENAEPWENIVDYLNRRYRIEQISQKKLMAELRMTALTIRATLLNVGIPRLHSSEYKDPTAEIPGFSFERMEEERVSVGRFRRQAITTS